MRILFHAPPLAGHVLPMLPLARALQAQGHAITWASAGDALDMLQKLGSDVHATGPDRGWAADELKRQWPERGSLTPKQVVAELGPRLFGDVYAPATLLPLLKLLDAWQPDLLVHDVMAHAAPLAAAMRGLRSVSHGFGLPRPQGSILSAESRMRPQWRAQGLEMPADCGNHRGGHVDICPPSMRLNEPIPAGLRWSMSPTSGVQRRVGSRQGILASFGTVHNLQATFDRLLAVLLQGPWPVRVAMGRSLDGSAKWPPHVHVAPWMDLAHEWAHCCVGACHGGAGTLLGGLAQGVPLLALPVAADQFRNARALEAVGAGLALSAEAVTDDAIRTALARLHDEAAFTQAAQAMADELAAMPQADTVARALLA